MIKSYLDLENIQKTQEDIPEEIKELTYNDKRSKKNKDWTLAINLKKSKNLDTTF